MNPFSLPAFKSPVERHMLSRDSLDESLEAFYFQILDELAAAGWSVEKVRDNYHAAPGSGLSADMARRQTSAQREVMQLLRQAHFLVQDIFERLERRKERLTPSAILCPATPAGSKPNGCYCSPRSTRSSSTPGGFRLTCGKSSNWTRRPVLAGRQICSILLLLKSPSWLIGNTR